MAPRAYWKGSLKLSLVTCPIALYPASTQAEKTHFHQINTKTGHRLKQQMVDEETGRVVDKEHKGRGYELSKGRYVQIEEDELDAVKIESTHTIEIDDFVPCRRYRRALSGQALLHRSQRKGGRGCLRRDPGRHEAEGKGGARSRGTFEPGARHRAEAFRQGLARHHTRVIRTNSETRTTISTTFPVRGSPRTWSIWLRISSIPRLRNSIRSKFKDKYETALKALVKRKAAGKTIEVPEAKGAGEQRHRSDGRVEAKPRSQEIEDEAGQERSAPDRAAARRKAA